ncbi:MAG: ferritin family protein, partial [Erysipelotrichaceae bacterium]
MNNLEFAITMEMDGEQFYTEQADANKDNSLGKLFLVLAKDERSHAKILKNRFNNLSYEMNVSSTVTEAVNVFKGVRDFKSEIRTTPTQLELYRDVLDREKKSIDLYKEMLAEALEEQDKELFEFLVLQETNHFTMFEEMVSLLTRPEEWVE